MNNDKRHIEKEQLRELASLVGDSRSIIGMSSINILFHLFIISCTWYIYSFLIECTTNPLALEARISSIMNWICAHIKEGSLFLFMWPTRMCNRHGIRRTIIRNKKLSIPILVLVLEMIFLLCVIIGCLLIIWLWVLEALLTIWHNTIRHGIQKSTQTLENDW